MSESPAPKNNDEAPLLTPKERNNFRRISIYLPMLYSFVAFICITVLLGLHNESIDPRVEEIQNLIIAVGKNVNSNLIWHFRAVNMSSACSSLNNITNETIYEEVPVAEFLEPKEGCLCADDLTKVAEPSRCDEVVDSVNPICKRFLLDSWRPEPKSAYEFTGGWKLCAARYNKTHQIFEDDKCHEGEYQYGIYCVDKNFPPIKNLKINVSIQFRADNITRRRIAYKVINMDFEFIKAYNSSNSSDIIDRSKPAIGVMGEIAQEGQIPCVNPYRGPNISVFNVTPYPLFKRKYIGCEKDGAYPPEYISDTNVLEPYWERGVKYRNQSYEDFFKNNNRTQDYALLPFFNKNGTYLNNNTFIRFFTYSRIDVGSKRACQELVEGGGHKLQEVPRNIKTFGIVIIVLGAFSMFIILIAIILIIAALIAGRKNLNNNYRDYVKNHKKNMHIAIFSFTIISSVIIFAQGIYFLVISNDMYYFQRLLTEDCLNIIAVRNAFAYFVDFLYHKFIRLAGVVIFLFVWSLLYILIFASVGIYLKVKGKDIFQIIEKNYA